MKRPFNVLLFLAVLWASAAPAGTQWVVVEAYSRGDFNQLAPLDLDVLSYNTADGLHVLATDSDLEALASLGYRWRVVDYDFSQVRFGSRGGDSFYGGYRTIAETEAELQELAADHPDIFDLFSLGHSYLDRDIWCMKVSDNPAVDEAEGEIFIHGNTHAREIMTLEIPMYFLNRIAEDYYTDPELAYLIDAHEVFIVPSINPDGHVWVEEHHDGSPYGWRRKNMRPPDGVDLNRNYGYMWGYDDHGSSPNPWSDLYRGTSPFSEPETMAVHDFFLDREFQFAVSYHSFGELILLPWGYVDEPTPDEATLREYGNAMNAVITGQGHGPYEVGRPGEILYPVNGDFDDWSYGGDYFPDGISPDDAFEGGVPGFSFEVNTEEEGGFAPPPAEIEPTCELHWPVFLWMLENGADAPAGSLTDLAATPVGDGVRISFNVCGCEEIYFILMREEADGWRPLNERPLEGYTDVMYYDLDVEPGGTYRYRVDVLGRYGDPTSYGPVEITLPPDGGRVVELRNAFPNPAVGGTNISFYMPEAGEVELAVYDAAGRRVATLADGYETAGEHAVSWDASGHAPGVYLYRLTADEAALVRRFVVSR
ncbi:MAG TPA: M14 family zinc carboxypeptidase [bacterium]|nr:M14 family zinc carboxypeptidase [bacterium]